MAGIARQRSAIVAVGTEIVTGLRQDTNTRDIAAALTSAGFDVAETCALGDDEGVLSAALRRLTASYELVVVTGGLGPTHDDITRDAAAQALGRPLREDPDLMSALETAAEMHVDPGAARQVFRQALVIEGARVLAPESGTAPGQVVDTAAGRLVLLPGPPHEMGPMLESVLAAAPGTIASRILSCVGISESDAQVRAQGALAGRGDVRLTLLGTPGLLDVVLFADGADAAALADAAADVRSALGDACFTDTGESLAAHVVRRANQQGIAIAAAESCTGGLLGAALTDIPGASGCFRGAIVAYSDDAKTAMLGIAHSLIARFGAVSERTAEAMAVGARERLSADVAVSITGIAGPDGGTVDKPVGLVWFGIATASTTHAYSRVLPGDRDGIRKRAVVFALDRLRRELAG